MAEELQAILLRKIPYGDQDLILGFLTEEKGRISMFARGARSSKKRFGQGLDLFCHVKAFCSSPRPGRSTMWTLSSVDIIDPYYSLRADLTRFALASYYAEMVWSFAADEMPLKKVFHWLLSSLKRMTDEHSLGKIIPRMDQECLSLFGIEPQLSHCGDCGSKPTAEKLFFSFDRGSILCACKRFVGEGRWLSSVILEKYLSEKDLSEIELFEMRKLFNAFVVYTLGKEPKSLRFREEAICEYR